MPKLGGLKLFHELQHIIGLLPVAFGRDLFFGLLREQGLLIRK